MAILKKWGQYKEAKESKASEGMLNPEGFDPNSPFNLRKDLKRNAAAMMKVKNPQKKY